jgi:hypothetical protein
MLVSIASELIEAVEPALLEVRVTGRGVRVLYCGYVAGAEVEKRSSDIDNVVGAFVGYKLVELTPV